MTVLGSIDISGFMSFRGVKRREIFQVGVNKAVAPRFLAPNVARNDIFKVIWQTSTGPSVSGIDIGNKLSILP